MNVNLNSLCQLCASTAQSYVEISDRNLPGVTELCQKIAKHLEVELTLNAVCKNCADKVESIHQFYNEVKNNQNNVIIQVIKLQQLQTTQLSLHIFEDSVQQPQPTFQEVTSTVQIINCSTPEISYDAIPSVLIDTTHEQINNENTEAINEANDEGEGPNEIEINKDIEVDENDAYETDGSNYLENDDNGGDDGSCSSEEEEGVDKVVYPKELIRDSKLIVRGKELFTLMSKFYRLECELCPKDKVTGLLVHFNRLTSMRLHYAKVHNIKGYVNCCGTKLVKPNSMAIHMACHLQPDAFKCPTCNKLMTCPRILKYHMQNHLPEEQRPLKCSECPRRFSYGSALKAHKLSHDLVATNFICDDCGSSFPSSGRLSTHITMVHQSRPPNVCHICAKQFTCRGNLNYHLTTHDPAGSAQVQCSECSKWLKNKLCLRKHMLQHSDKKLNCDQCNYSTINRQSLTNHLRVKHSDVKPFHCQYCNKSFKLKNILKDHLTQHTGLRRYACDFCERTFASSGNFYSHRKRMHPSQMADMIRSKEDKARKVREKIIQQQKTS